MRRVEVKASRNYEILIGRGLVQEAGKWIKEAVSSCAAALITDDITRRAFPSFLCPLQAAF